MISRRAAHARGEGLGQTGPAMRQHMRLRGLECPLHTLALLDRLGPARLGSGQSWVGSTQNPGQTILAWFGSSDNWLGQFMGRFIIAIRVIPRLL